MPPQRLDALTEVLEALLFGVEHHSLLGIVRRPWGAAAADIIHRRAEDKRQGWAAIPGPA
jgi:hypothetical protein